MINIDTTRDNLTISVPEQLLDGSFRFIILNKREKDPFDSSWQKKYNYSHSDARFTNFLERGHNYGLLCRDNDVCILDADDFQRLEQLGALDCFNDTFTVRTGSDEGERYHYYFRCPGLGNKKIPFYDLADNSRHLGELYATGANAYCVGPNSIHPSGNRYLVVNNAPIKTLTPEQVDSVFFSKVKSKRGVSRSRDDTQLKNKMPISAYSYRQNTITSALNLNISDFGYPMGEVFKRNDEIQGSHPVHGSTSGANYAINPGKNVWHCFPAGTLVNTANGMIPIETIQIGDLVYDMDGNLTKVATTFRQGYVGDAYTIHSALYPVMATKGHEIYIARCNRCVKDYVEYDEMWVPIEDINPDTDFLIVPKNKFVTSSNDFTRYIYAKCIWVTSENAYIPINSITRSDYCGDVFNLETESHSYQVPFVVHNCFRCGSGGDPLTFLAVRHGIIRCEDAGDVRFDGDMLRQLKTILADEYGYKDEIKQMDLDFKNGYTDIREIDENQFTDIINQRRGLIFQPNLPDNHFLTKYADTICELTDSYRDYQYMAGMMLVSMAIQRKAVMRFSHGEVHPNVWIMLLGASSYSKKSTAIKFARNIANSIVPFSGIAEDITPERFGQDISEYKAVWQFVDEASSILTSMKTKAYMSNLREFLCKMYDNVPHKMSRSKRGRPRRGEEQQHDWIIQDGYVNLFYATTPEMFSDSTTRDDITSGLFYRFLFCYPRYEKEIMPTKEETVEHREGFEELRDWVEVLFKFFSSHPTETVRVRMSDEGLKFYQDWEVGWDQKLHHSDDRDKQSAFSRMKDIAVRIMMIFEFGSYEFFHFVRQNNYQLNSGDRWEIRLETVKEVCHQVETYFMPIFEEIMLKMRAGMEKTVQDRILTCIDDHGGIMPLRELRIRVRTNRRNDWEDALRVLTTNMPEGTEELEIINMRASSTRKMSRYIARRGIVSREEKIARDATNEAEWSPGDY